MRGTSRHTAGLKAIEVAGIEAVQADPAQPGTVLELVGDVAVVVWLLGSARPEARGAGEAAGEEEIAAIHGTRLERLLEKLVDTPVRGFVYEAAGTVPSHRLQHGKALVELAGERWRIPVAAVAADPEDASSWAEEMLTATLKLASPAGNSI
ncbi:MAG TPA: hypothetical protein VIE64_07910 [Solirubrobacterales bacterium]